MNNILTLLILHFFFFSTSFLFGLGLGTEINNQSKNEIYLKLKQEKEFSKFKFFFSALIIKNKIDNLKEKYIENLTFDSFSPNISIKKNKIITPLMLVLREGNLEYVKYLIEKQNASIVHNPNYQFPLLKYAVQSKNISIIKYLINKKINLNNVGTFKYKIMSKNSVTTLFITAVYFIQTTKKQSIKKILKLFLENGADPNINSKKGDSNILKNIPNLDENDDIILLFLDYGAKLYYKKFLSIAKVNKSKIIKKAITLINTIKKHKEQSKKPDCKDSILTKDILKISNIFKKDPTFPINGRDFDGRTAIHYACMIKDKSFLQILLDRHPKLYLRDDNNYSPLDYACEKGNLNVVELLLSNKPEKLYGNKYEECLEYALKITKNKIKNICSIKNKIKKYENEKTPLLSKLDNNQNYYDIKETLENILNKNA